MHHFEKKIQKFFPQRGPTKMFGGPARMFPWAPLWLTMGLGLFITVPYCVSYLAFAITAKADRKPLIRAKKLFPYFSPVPT